MNIVAQVDRLRAKQWIVIRRKDSDDHQEDMIGELWKRAKPKVRWMGPYRIVETELPLLVVEIEGRREMLHADDYDFSIVSQKLARALYADLWGGNDRAVVMANGNTINFSKKRRKRKEPVSEQTCPTCQFPRRKRKLLKIEGVLREVWFCPECGKGGQTVGPM
jgi:hypothetical protein